MSMLSSMCEKLRKTAGEVERIKHNNADWLWRDGVTLIDAVRELRDAADTIDNLRGMCQDVQFENEKLRELVGLMDGRDVLLPCWRGCDADCRFYDGTCERIGTLMGELGFEVDE